MESHSSLIYELRQEVWAETVEKCLEPCSQPGTCPFHPRREHATLNLNLSTRREILFCWGGMMSAAHSGVPALK